MSSPKFVDDSFSPVKLPASATVPSLRSPSNLIIHPHGLTAKHNAVSGKRRNTIHATQRRSLAATPLSVSPSLSPSRDTNDNIKSVPYPLTSPRANSKKFNIESIKRSKTKLDSRLGAAASEEKENKEYGSPNLDTSLISDDHISSPIKRTKGHGKARKIAKVVTSAETNENSVQVNEIFYKEDLVGQLSSAKSSPVKSTKSTTKDPLPATISSSPGKENIVPSLPPPVIDNESDSDPEDYGRIENTISQTLMPNTSTFQNTLTNNIISLEEAADYITPQRPTEPVAKSPATNQQVRVQEVVDEDIDLETIDKSDLKDSTYPMKTNAANIYKDVSESIGENIGEVVEEPTSNFIIPPKSKPIFSITQLEEMQKDDKNKIDKLRENVKTKDAQIEDLSQKLTKSQHQLLVLQNQYDRTVEACEDLLEGAEIQTKQINDYSQEVAKLTKEIKIKENSISQLKHELSQSQQENADLKSQVSRATEELERSKATNNQYDIENQQLVRKLEEIPELKRKNEELAHEIDNLKDINTKQEELLKELDNLETLANEKISNLEKTIETQNHDLETSLASYKSQKAELERQLQEYERRELELVSNESEIKYQMAKTADELQSAQTLNKKLELKIENLEVEIESIVQANDQKVGDLKAVIEQKESIINEDVAKLSELLEAIEKKKKYYEDELAYYKSEVEKYQKSASSDKQLQSKVEYLQEQLKQQEVESSNKIDEVAAFLHKQYAEKHTRKLGEVRDQYERELSEVGTEKKSLLREIDSLKRKLNRAHEENQKVTEFVHTHKLKYPNISSEGGSPKRKYGRY